jgi:glyoxylase-like metal-dependent hydrolase (beta-lactamase superfamily II)
MYKIDVLIQGFPGKSVCHGGLGWSTVALLRGEGKTILMDTGSFGMRRHLGNQLKKHGVEAGDVTDVVLSHAHYDHSVNFTLFPNARVYIGAVELDWAQKQPPGFNPLPEVYVRELANYKKLTLLEDGQKGFLPGMSAHITPGHTPGSMVYYLENGATNVVFTGDAAKNRSELLSMAADMTYDASISLKSFETIWGLWRRVPGSLLIPGHDLSMLIGEDNRPVYVGKRAASILGWFGESIEETTEINLCCDPPQRVFSSLAS